MRPLEHERVYLPLAKVADTPFHIQGDEWLSHQFQHFIAVAHIRVGIFFDFRFFADIFAYIFD